MRTRRSNIVIVTRKGLSWYQTGHAWIYRDDLNDFSSAKSGGIVDVLDERKRFLGRALYGGKSKIAVRFITRRDESIDDSFFNRRIKEAIDRRARLLQERDALRLFYSEGDGLPGLIVDKYAAWIVIQALTPGIDMRLNLLAEILASHFSPEGIVCRNDAGSRAMEGLPLEKKVLRGGTPEPIMIKEGDIAYIADIWNGQKTGAYLDQQENRIAMGRLARGNVLDCFSYQGHFALHCAKTASSVTAVESSGEAVAVTARNCAINKINNISISEANAFDLLRGYHREKKRFDTVILDPPPLARKRAHADDAIRGYKEINLRAMHILNPGGMLATFCCSHSISRDLFFDILRSAAADTRSGFRILGGFGQSPDHPVLLQVPETEYLKGFLLKKEEN